MPGSVKGADTSQKGKGRSSPRNTLKENGLARGCRHCPDALQRAADSPAPICGRRRTVLSVVWYSLSAGSDFRRGPKRGGEVGGGSLIPFIYTRRFAWIVVATLALIIAVLSLTPNPEEILPVTLWDKLSHFLAYAPLALSLGHALACSGWDKRRLIIGGILLSTAYGALMEGLQFFTPPRAPELLDALSNFLGSCSGMICYLLLDFILSGPVRQGQRGR
jgi:VanZ family protein